ncbi:MAG: RtcB family protein [Methanomicrobiales archaeon]
MLEGIHRCGPFEWEVPRGYVEGMRVPGRFYLSEALAPSLEEGAIRQLANVATLPGIVRSSLAMPDIHWGYGFPIGGVAAFSCDTGIISPGGVGFDINCGVRLMATPLTADDIRSHRRKLIEELYRTIPTGVGAKAGHRVSHRELEEIMTDGARWAVAQGYGTDRDLERCEDGGAIPAADPNAVSDRARSRGLPQVGTLGSGNHFLEVQVIDRIYDEAAARAFGVEEGQVCVMIHCGSRGLGHQVCTDHLQTLEKATRRYGIPLPDRQLACAPITSPEGEQYFAGMAAAANYAFANRQMILHHTREVFSRIFSLSPGEMPLVYDVAHNVAKCEEHDVDGQRQRLCVHRKGATRAFGPGRPEVPLGCREVGQPVLIPGSMGTPSFLLAGTETAMEKTFGSTCHGAGRVMSRAKAKKRQHGNSVRDELEKEGIYVRAPSAASIAEEAPAAYKPSEEVVRVVHESGLSRRVARLSSLGVIKG